MGSTSWSTDFYNTKNTDKKRLGVDAFAYDAKLKSTVAPDKWKVHDNMNPLNVIRESRDSAAHPDSIAIGVIFDVTGSMGGIPRTLQTKLAKLMELLISKGVIEHPQILFGAFGDAYSDRIPLQIGQFESGVEMDDDLAKIVLEGRGGGQHHETSELALYFMARKTSIDCFEKRHKRGYLFTISDECCYPIVKKEHVKDLIGDNLEANIPTEQIIKEVNEKYEYFHIHASGGSYGTQSKILDPWKKLLGERVLILDNSDAVCELIALQIALTEGVYDLDEGLSKLDEFGTDINTRKSVEKTLSTYVKSTGLVKKAAVTNGIIPVEDTTDVVL